MSRAIPTDAAMPRLDSPPEAAKTTLARSTCRRGSVRDRTQDEIPPQPEWKPVGYAESTPVRVTRLDDALRVDITEANYRTGQTGNISHDGWIYIDVPDLRPEDWGYVSVRARAQPGVRFVGLMFNLTDRSDPSQTPDSEYEPAGGWPLKYFADEAPLITDGLVHTYLLRVGTRSVATSNNGSCTHTRQRAWSTACGCPMADVSFPSR